MPTAAAGQPTGGDKDAEGRAPEEQDRRGACPTETEAGASAGAGADAGADAADSARDPGSQEEDKVTLAEGTAQPQGRSGKDGEAPSGPLFSESAAVSPSATAAVASDTSPPRKRARSASRSPSPERTNPAKQAKTSPSSTPSQNSDATTATSGNLEATQEVASNLCGILIGRGGSIISQMRAQSGSRITISPAGQTPSTRTICYTGTASAIALAQSLVVQQLRSNNAPLDALGAASAPAPAGTAIRKNNMTRTETIACPMTHVGGLIGKEAL